MPRETFNEYNNTRNTSQEQEKWRFAVLKTIVGSILVENINRVFSKTIQSICTIERALHNFEPHIAIVDIKIDQRQCEQIQTDNLHIYNCPTLSILFFSLCNERTLLIYIAKWKVSLKMTSA